MLKSWLPVLTVTEVGYKAPEKGTATPDLTNLKKSLGCLNEPHQKAKDNHLGIFSPLASVPWEVRGTGRVEGADKKNTIKIYGGMNA